MSKAFSITRETLDELQQYRDELILLADQRIDLLQAELRREEEWRAWCVDAAPVILYSKRKDSLEREANQRNDAEVKQLQAQTRIKLQKNNQFLIGCLIAISILLYIGLEWYASTSYGNFCYRIGSHIITLIFCAFVIGAVISIGVWLSRSREKI